MSSREIRAAVAEIDARLAAARAQAIAGLLTGIQQARTGQPFPDSARREATWWGDGVVMGYDAAKDT